MPGAATVGVLRVLMSADSAQITSDLGKARKAVADTRADFALFGRSGKDAKQVFVDISSATGRMKDAKEITGLLGRALGGVSGEAAKATHFLGELATEGLTGYTLAAGTAAAAVAFAVTTISQAWRDAKGAAEDAGKAAVQAMARVREYGAERFDALRGTHLAPAAAAEHRLVEAVQARARAYREMRESGFGIVGATRAYLKAEEDVNEAYRERARVVDRLLVAEARAVRDLDRAMEEIAGDRERDAHLARLPEDARKAEREVAALGRTLADLTGRVGLSAEDARAAVQAGLVDQETARNLTQDRAEAERRAAGFLREQADAIRQRVAADSLAALQAEVAAAEKEWEFAQLGLEADRKDFEIRQRIRALEASAHPWSLADPASDVNRRIDLLTKLLHLTRQTAQTREGQEAARRSTEAMARLDEEAARAAEAAAASSARADEREWAALTEALGARLDAERRYNETVADLGRTETERALREVDRRYEDLLAEARDYGIETVDLERHIEAEKARVRADAARREREERLQAAVTGPDFGEGFRARIAVIGDELSSMGRLGAAAADQVTTSLADGLTRALEDVATGARSAKDAFRDYAASVLRDIARLITQTLALKAVQAGIGYFTGGGDGGGGGTPNYHGTETPAFAPDAGGTGLAVGSLKGLDSALSGLRTAPAAFASSGARAGGASGDVHVSLSVRPPAVIADDVGARMSREAKAEIVAAALHRGTRRGERAPT